MFMLLYWMRSKCIYLEKILTTNEMRNKFILPEDFIIIFEIFCETMLFLSLLASLESFAAICVYYCSKCPEVMHSLAVMFLYTFKRS